MRRHIRVRVLNPHRRHRRRSRRKHTHFGRVRAHRRRVNPFAGFRSNRKRRSRSRRRNPVGLKGLGRGVKASVSMKNIIRYVAMGGGFLVGNQVQNFLQTGRFFNFGPASAPAWTVSIAPARPVFGLAQIVLGGLIASRSRNPWVKDASVGIAVAGGVDIVAQVMTLARPKAVAGVDMRDPRVGVNMPASMLHGNSPMFDNESSMG